MGTLYPTLPIAVVLAIFTLLAKHALDMRKEKNYREMWGSWSLSLVPAALFCLWVASGESSMLTRNLILIPAGALLGACAFAYAGYLWHDMTAAAQPGGKSDQSTVTDSKPPVNVFGNQNVLSFGQVGGQTAHTIINQGLPPRTISSAARTGLVEALKPPEGKKPKVTVDCANDGNATQYADQWEAILRDAGWDVTTGASIISASPLVGIRIAIKSADTFGAAPLQQALAMMGEQAPGEIDPAIPAGEIRLKIGSRQ
jgi:hypothetical protein